MRVRLLWGAVRFSLEQAKRLSSLGGRKMGAIDRITFNPDVMGGKPCIRGLRVTVGTIVGMVATGHTKKVGVRGQTRI